METQERVWDACERLRSARLADIEDITPAFATMLVTFATIPEHRAAAAQVLEELSKNTRRDRSHSQSVEIPVCYAEEFAPDLAEVARMHDLSPDAVIELHSSSVYRVAFIGFTPGFPYLLGLPTEIATPRLSSPRVRIPAGSVAIAADQCGIYPGNTPGGWRIVGRTPCRIFEPKRAPQSLLAAGDAVTFRPVTLAEFEKMERA